LIHFYKRGEMCLWTRALSFLLIVAVKAQQQKDDEPGESEGVKCFTCGLEEINPHADKPGSYSNRVHLEEESYEVQDTGLKMYNHSCFEMDSRTGQDVPFILNWEKLNTFMSTLDHTNAVMEKLNSIGSVTTEKGTYSYSYNLQPGFKVYEDLYEELVLRLKENPCIPKQPDLPNPCQVPMPAWRQFEEDVDANYNMDMWVKQCDSGIVSCFEAKGDYDNQLPTFRGCAGTAFPHDEKCAYEKQAVSIVEGKKSVDVGVSLCYCNSDLCNQDASNSPVLVKPFSILLLIVVFASPLL